MGIIVFYRGLEKRKVENMDERGTLNLESLSSCVLHQKKEWAEIIVGIESRNKYQLLTIEGHPIGFLAEIGSGFFHFIKRNLLRTHRSLKIQVWDNQKREAFYFNRPFYWFFSDIEVYDTGHKRLGSAHRKFSFFSKIYDICDENGVVFSKIRAPFWRIWKFPILNQRGDEVGFIQKKWGGFLKEVFTDADNFLIEFPKDYSQQLKTVILATTVIIDLDYFDDNQRARSTFFGQQN